MKKAFTLAEVLTTLTVIGIVAAIVIPSLITDINEKAFDTQRKALYARFSQAIPLMPKIAGYGTLTSSADTASETFITEGLSKVIKMNNICYSDNLSDCNFPESFSAVNGSTTITTASISTLGTLNPLFLNTDTITEIGKKYEQLNTKASAFETVNGESILVYYNPNCVANLNESAIHFAQSKMCVNFIYDLNGSKAPNTVGKDIGFISVLYSSNPTVVAPLPLSANATSATHAQASQSCKNQDKESRLPNKDEIASLFYNMKLANLSASDNNLWSGSVATQGSDGKAWRQNFYNGGRAPVNKTNSLTIRCIKK